MSKLSISQESGQLNLPDSSYPRPDFLRAGLHWYDLRGEWRFCFDDKDAGTVSQWFLFGLPESELTTITVPYVFQTKASGINKRDAHEIIWYERTVRLGDIRPQKQPEPQVLLRFGAVDYEAKIWVNSIPCGGHCGGHVPFDIDITDAIAISTDGADDASLRLTVRVRDSPYDKAQPRGKQYWKPQSEGIFYTPSSGIWQPVWIEAHDRLPRIADSSSGTIVRSTNIDEGIVSAKIAITGRIIDESLCVELEIVLEGFDITKSKTEPTDLDFISTDICLKLSEDKVKEFMNHRHISEYHSTTGSWRHGIALWAPEHPLLYTLTIRLYRSDECIDTVITQFGMRSIEWHSNKFWLNSKPYFQALLLDQGYWPDTGITAPSTEDLKRDIELSKAMGFNGCRKHQKVEDPYFLWWADKLGFLVWGEMANAFDFNETYVENFNCEWMEAVRRDINHPSVVTWTPANESWGYPSLKDSIIQRNHLRALYYMTKTIDPTRPINDNCGWEHVITDLLTFHDYAEADVLGTTCSSYEGICSRKGGNEVLVKAIDGSPGACHSMKDSGASILPDAPIICTEFGGINVAPASGEEAKEGDWGYTTASDAEDFLKRIEAMVNAIVEGKLCCGFVYTQLTDIEQEVNGLLSFDRRPKVDPNRLKTVLEKAKSKYYDFVSTN